MLVSLVVVTLVSAAMCRQRGARSAFPCFDKGWSHVGFGCSWGGVLISPWTEGEMLPLLSICTCEGSALGAQDW